MNTKVMTTMLFAVLSTFSTTWAATMDSEGNKLLNYSGRIVKADGTPLEASSVTFAISVYSPNPGKCLLWRENQVVSMTKSSGVFSLLIGKTANKHASTPAAVSTFADAMNNSGTLASLSCDSGTSYSPGANDDRQVIVSFNDGSGSQTLSAMDVKSVPFAMHAAKADEAAKVGGKAISATAPTHGQALIYDNPSGTWVPTTLGGGTGTVTSTSVTSANGFGGSVTNSTTTPAITITTSVTGLLKGDGTGVSAAVAGTDYLSGTVGVANGGTGLTSYTTGDLIYASGAAALSKLSAGTSGYVLTSNGAGAAPSWQAAAAGDITDVTAGTGLSGGGTSGSVTLNLANIAASSVLANNTGGAAAPTAIGYSTLAPALLNSISSTQGDILYRNGTTWVALPAGTNGQYLQTQGAGANPQWATVSAGSGTVNSGTANQLAYYSGSGTAVSGLTTANNGVLVTNGSGVPSIGSTLPTAVQGNITSLGTITSGTWNGSAIGAQYGGTGLNSSAASNGQLLIGNGSGFSLAGITGTANQVSVTNGAGSITLSTPQNIHTGASPTFAGSTFSATGKSLVVNTGIANQVVYTPSAAEDFNIVSSNSINLVSSTSGHVTFTPGGTGNVGVKTSSPVDTLSIGSAPIASATRAQVNFSNTALSGGSANGTYLGMNPAAFSGNFIDFQVGGTSRFKVSSTGVITGDGSGLTNISGAISGLTAGRVALSTGATTVGDSANLTFNSTTGAMVINGSAPGITITGAAPWTTAGFVKNTAGGVFSGGNSVALGSDVSGQLPLANGGTNANLTASNGGIVWSDANSMEILAPAGTAGLPLLSGASATPSWSTINLGGGNITMPAGGNISNASGAMTVSAATNLTLQSNSGSTTTVGNAVGASAAVINGGGVGGSITLTPGTLGTVNSGAMTINHTSSGVLALNNTSLGSQIQFSLSSGENGIFGNPQKPFHVGGASQMLLKGSSEGAAVPGVKFQTLDATGPLLTMTANGNEKLRYEINGAGELQMITNNSHFYLLPTGTGNVGIGSITTPTEKLQVEGNIKSTGSITGGQIRNTASVTDGGTIGTLSEAGELADANLITTAHDCGTAIALGNALPDGASVSVVVTGTGTTMCTFTATGVTQWRYSPTNAVRTASSHTVYTMIRVGAIVYISWITGFVL